MTERVSLSDLESKLRSLTGSAERAATKAALPAAGVGSAVAVLVVAGIYLLGRRRGRKEAPVLEIRRI
ncbi:MAG: hypothetical protein ACRDZ5_04030 [Acidimicrobiales bacterium]